MILNMEKKLEKDMKNQKKENKLENKLIIKDVKNIPNIIVSMNGSSITIDYNSIMRKTVYVLNAICL